MLLSVGGAACAHAAGPNPNATQGYLGVGLRDVSDAQLNALKLKEARGAEVLSVDHDGPAGKIGLQVHDVILQMNGEVIQGQEQLRRMLHETPAGRNVTLLISRDGQQQTLQTQLANREEVERRAWEDHLTVPQPAANGDLAVEPGPASGGRPAGPPPGGMGFFHGGGALTGRTHALLSLGGPYTGAMVEPVGAQLAQFFGVSNGTGLLVKNVDNNSPAATAGLRAGDIVVKANQTTLSTPGDWSHVMHQSKGQPVSLTVMRDKKEQTLSLTPDSKRRSAVEWPFDPGFADLPPVTSGTLTAELQPLNLPDLSAARDGISAQQRAVQTQDLRKMLDDASRNMPSEAELQKMIDEAKRNVPSQADLQKMMDDAKRNLPNQAELQKMIAEAQRNTPDRAELERMLRDAKTLQLNNGDLRLKLQDLQKGFGPDFQIELNDLREQMMLSMPGSMD